MYQNQLKSQLRPEVGVRIFASLLLWASSSAALRARLERSPVVKAGTRRTFAIRGPSQLSGTQSI